MKNARKIACGATTAAGIRFYLVFQDHGHCRMDAEFLEQVEELA